MKALLFLFICLSFLGCSNQDPYTELTWLRDECWHRGGEFSYKWGVVKESFGGSWYGYITKCVVSKESK